MSDSSTASSSSSNCTVIIASTDASSTIFSIPNLDFELATWCMIALIVFTILFESSLHRMERQLLTHTHYLKILSKVYKELMILGFISFSILIILQVFDLSESTTETLEFVHVWFFFIAVLYAIHVLVYMILARRDKRRYDVATYMRIPDLLEQYRVSQEEAHALANDPSTMASIHRTISSLLQVSFISSIFSSIYQSSHTQLYQQMQFHIVRSLFIRTYNLPNNFDFAKYLRRCMSKHITEQLDIKETSWLILIGFLLINVVRVVIEADYGDTDYNIVTLWLFLFIPYFLLALSFLAVIGIETAKKNLMQKVGVEKVTDLEQALVRSRAKTGNSNSTMKKSQKNQRASMIMIDQQEALDAYLPLLLKGLFPYDRPTLFPKMLEVIMLTQCFFIGLACIFHIRESFESFSYTIAIFYVIFTMLPHLVVLLLIAPHVMTTYVFVHSVGYVNKDVLQHVNDFMEETETLKKEIQNFLQNYLISKKLTLPTLFTQLSGGHLSISTTSLKSVLNHIGIELTNSQVSRLIRMINLEQNGHIDMREFSLFFLGSEGTQHLSLIPIKESTRGQLAMITERSREQIIDQEIEKANKVRDDTVIPVHDPHEFTDNVLHDPEATHRPGAGPGAGAGVAGLDLRHVGKVVKEGNIFIPHTLDHSNSLPSLHLHEVKEGKGKMGKVGKVGVGRTDVDALDFAACFHGAETVCQRCGGVVLVKRINEHVAECKLRAGMLGATAAGDMAGGLTRLRAGRTQHHGDEAVAGSSGSSGAQVLASLSMDDIVLNDSRGGSKRSTRASGRLLPLTVKPDGKVELFAVQEEDDAAAKGSSKEQTQAKGKANVMGPVKGEAQGAREAEQAQDTQSRRGRATLSGGRQRASNGSM